MQEAGPLQMLRLVETGLPVRDVSTALTRGEARRSQLEKSGHVVGSPVTIATFGETDLLDVQEIVTELCLFEAPTEGTMRRGIGAVVAPDLPGSGPWVGWGAWREPRPDLPLVGVLYARLDPVKRRLDATSDHPLGLAGAVLSDIMSLWADDAARVRERFGGAPGSLEICPCVGLKGADLVLLLRTEDLAGWALAVGVLRSREEIELTQSVLGMRVTRQEGRWDIERLPDPLQARAVQGSLLCRLRYPAGAGADARRTIRDLLGVVEPKSLVLGKFHAWTVREGLDLRGMRDILRRLAGLEGGIPVGTTDTNPYVELIDVDAAEGAAVTPGRSSRQQVDSTPGSDVGTLVDRWLARCRAARVPYAVTNSGAGLITTVFNGFRADPETWVPLVEAVSHLALDADLRDARWGDVYDAADIAACELARQGSPFDPPSSPLSFEGIASGGIARAAFDAYVAATATAFGIEKPWLTLERAAYPPHVSQPFVVEDRAVLWTRVFDMHHVVAWVASHELAHMKGALRDWQARNDAKVRTLKVQDTWANALREAVSDLAWFATLGDVDLFWFCYGPALVRSLFEDRSPRDSLYDALRRLLVVEAALDSRVQHVFVNTLTDLDADLGGLASELLGDVVCDFRLDLPEITSNPCFELVRRHVRCMRDLCGLDGSPWPRMVTSEGWSMVALARGGYRFADPDVARAYHSDRVRTLLRLAELGRPGRYEFSPRAHGASR